MILRLPHLGSVAGVCLAFLIAPAQEPASDKPDISLPPISVRGIQVAPDFPSDRLRVEMFFNLTLDLGWTTTNGNFMITPSRVPQSSRNNAFSGNVLEAPAIVRTPAVNLPGVLQWALGREANSGESVRLRGMRAVILRDRLPAVNPFDGSVPWNELPREGLIRAEVVPGGGATAWDGGAVGGVIQLFTQPPRGRLVTEPGNGRGRALDGGPLKQRVLPVTQLTASLGELGTRNAEWNATQPTTKGFLQVLGGIHSSDGFDVLDAGQRGGIDERAWNRGRWIEARWRQPAGKEAELTASFRAYENSTGHGTPGQNRLEQGTMLSLAMAGARTGGLAWNGALYLQNDDTEARLSSIDALRLTETPTRRLVGMPTSALGASWTGSWWNFGDSRTTVGADVRHVRGESREEFAFMNGDFTREAVGGGRQNRLGVFILQQQPLGSTVRATFGARFEAWNEASGRHREIDRATAATLLDERSANDEGVGFVPSAGLVWQINKAWRMRTSGQSTFRRPTLAERYQTWGWQGTLTQAGPALTAEKNTSLEAAFEYAPSAGITFDAMAFQNRLRDSIGSRAFTGISASPPGLSVRQRINIDRAEVRGLQFSAGWRLAGTIALKASLQFNDTLISRSSTTPALIGKRLANIPDRVVFLDATWQATKKLHWSFRLRSLGRQFADEENTLRLADALLADVGTSYRLNTRTELYFLAENMGDARFATNRDPSGLFYLGSPRLVVAGVRLNW